MNIRLYFIFFQLLILSSLFAQDKEVLWLDWSWQDNEILLNNSPNVSLEVDLLFQGKSKVSISLANAIYQNCTPNELTQLNFDDYGIVPELSLKQGFERNKTKISASIVPFIVENGVLKKLIYAELNVSRIPSQRKLNNYNDNSILNSGTWFKLSVVSNGVHKLDYNDLVSSQGGSPTLGFRNSHHHRQGSSGNNMDYFLDPRVPRGALDKRPIPRGLRCSALHGRVDHSSFDAFFKEIIDRRYYSNLSVNLSSVPSTQNQAPDSSNLIRRSHDSFAFSNDLV